ncbi:MAG: hypothetical protein MK078_15455 [Crocinitomicaceae bacterium]|nr:hypothetical protein [Crocinitomicaceae bacterium]
MRSLIIISIFAGLFSGSVESKLKLEDLILESDQLPKSCELIHVEADEDLPCNAKSNPYISSEEEFLNCFTSSLVSVDSLRKKVVAGLFSVYTDGAEIGVFALETESENSAKLIWNQLQDDRVNIEQSDYLLSGSIVIWLWRDTGKNDNYLKFKELIEAKGY